MWVVMVTFTHTINKKTALNFKLPVYLSPEERSSDL